MLKQSFITVSSAIGLCSILLGISGCAKQEYVKEQTLTTVAAVGFRQLPAKIDIMIVADNTPSANMAYPTLQSEVSSFIAGLDSQYWDYHVAQMPIEYGSTNPYPINRVLVSSKYNTAVLSDGTMTNASGLVPAGKAETNAANFSLGNFSMFATGNGDNTYSNLYNTLVHSNDMGANFLRGDAPLAIVVISNGYDRTVTDRYGSYTSTGYASLLNHKNNLVSLKGSTSMLRFYSVAAYGWTDSGCLGGPSLPGTSYTVMNQFIPGSSANFCSTAALQNVFDDIAANLQIVRQAYVYTRIVLDRAPIINDKFVLNKNGQRVVESRTNGFQYLGYQENVCTVTHIKDPNTGEITPINPCIDRRSGYVVELYGSARMIGSDAYDLVNEWQ